MTAASILYDVRVFHYIVVYYNRLPWYVDTGEGCVGMISGPVS